MIAAAVAVVALVAQAAFSSGTLVVAVPTNDGLVVAADSRREYRGQFADVNRPKLHVIDREKAPPMVFALTGSFEAHEPPFGMSLHDWLESSPREFDGSVVVHETLLARPERLTQATVEAATSGLFESFRRYLETKPGLVRRNAFLCRILIFQVTTSGSMIIGTSGLGVDSGARVIVVEAPALQSISRSDGARGDLVFGARDYTNTFVLQGAGRKLIPDRLLKLFHTGKRVRNLRQKDGWLYSNALIDATARMMVDNPPPGGANVGGPVRGYLLTASRVSSLDSKP